MYLIWEKTIACDQMLRDFSVTGLGQNIKNMYFCKKNTKSIFIGLQREIHVIKT